MKEFKGKKVEPRQIDGAELKDCPHYFQKGKYIGFCNLDNQPHGIGELISNDNDENPWSLNGEWENGIFISGSYNQPYISRYEGSFSFDDRIGSGDLELHGQGIELYYHSKENYLNNKIIGHVKGIFEYGSLLEGEIINPSLIEYSELKWIKKITYQKRVGSSKTSDGYNNQLRYGKIYYEKMPDEVISGPNGQGIEYEGEIDWDTPHGEGTMTYENGFKLTGKWENGSLDSQN